MTPVINVRAPSAPRTKKRRSGGRRRSSGSGQLTSQTMLGAGIGGLAYGFIEKTFPNMPTVPVLGKPGTVALAAYVLRGKVKFARDVGIAASVLAGYQLGKEGHILGDGIVPQVRGVAAQV